MEIAFHPTSQKVYPSIVQFKLQSRKSHKTLTLPNTCTFAQSLSLAHAANLFQCFVARLQEVAQMKQRDLTTSSVARQLVTDISRSAMPKHGNHLGEATFYTMSTPDCEVSVCHLQRERLFSRDSFKRILAMTVVFKIAAYFCKTENTSVKAPPNPKRIMTYLGKYAFPGFMM